MRDAPLRWQSLAGGARLPWRPAPQPLVLLRPDRQACGYHCPGGSTAECKMGVYMFKASYPAGG